MPFHHTIGGTRYSFADLRELLAKATPLRSGDVLAGVAARSAEERVAAQFALAELPLAHYLDEQVVPYEDDEVTRLIADTHDAEAFAPVRSLTVGELRDWLLSDEATEERLALISSEQQLELYDASAEHLATVALPDAASAAPAVDALGRVFVPLKRGALLALSRSGAPLGCMQVGHSPLGSPVLDAARRRVLVTAREGVLAAFEVP